jgi:type I restriction enzyme R subunit
MKACDPDAQIEKAKEKFATQTPTPAQVKKATEELAQAATMPFMKAAFRRRILEIRAQNEQTIDRHTIDSVLYSGFDVSAVEKAQDKVKDFRKWLDDHKDEVTALQVIYAGARPLKISLKELRKLRDALAAPPLAATPTQLWRAFEAVEAGAVKGSGGSQLADLVNLVRHAIQPSMSLAPYADTVRQRYAAWLAEKNANTKFTREQHEWLDRMAEHIATSLEIRPDDFQDGWFGQHGSLGRAHVLFGDRLHPLLAELNERLAA